MVVFEKEASRLGVDVEERVRRGIRHARIEGQHISRGRIGGFFYYCLSVRLYRIGTTRASGRQCLQILRRNSDGRDGRSVNVVIESIIVIFWSIWLKVSVWRVEVEVQA